MSGRLVGEVLAFAPAGLRPSERCVLLALAERARDRDRTCRRYPVSAMCADLGLSERAVRYALATLADAGIVARLVPPERLHRGVCQEFFLAPLRDFHRGLPVTRKGAPACTLHPVDNPSEGCNGSCKKGAPCCTPSVSTQLPVQDRSSYISAAVSRARARTRAS